MKQNCRDLDRAIRWKRNARLLVWPLSVNQDSLLKLLIDAQYYESQVCIDFGDADELVEHYIRIGWRNGFDPSPTFRATRYLDATFGRRDIGQNPFSHYLFETIGEADLTHAFAGLSSADISKLRSHFDADWYLHNHPDVETSGHDPFIHYMICGWRGLRDPSRVFSTALYLNLYSDIKSAGLNPFQHWVLHGIAEGRSGVEAERSSFNSWESLRALPKSCCVQ